MDVGERRLSQGELQSSGTIVPADRKPEAIDLPKPKFQSIGRTPRAIECWSVGLIIALVSKE